MWHGTAFKKENALTLRCVFSSVYWIVIHRETSQWSENNKSQDGQSVFQEHETSQRPEKNKSQDGQSVFQEHETSQWPDNGKYIGG